MRHTECRCTTSKRNSANCTEAKSVEGSLIAIPNAAARLASSPELSWSSQGIAVEIRVTQGDYVLGRDQVREHGKRASAVSEPREPGGTDPAVDLQAPGLPAKILSYRSGHRTCPKAIMMICDGARRRNSNGLSRATGLSGRKSMRKKGARASS